MDININNISFSYGEKKIFDSFSLKLHSDVTVLVGNSGSGKTTLLKLIAGLLTPTDGEILCKPKRPSFMFQSDRLLPWLSIYDNIKAVSNKKDSGEVDKLLALMEIDELKNMMPEVLSGGQKRRAALARALYYEGDMLILDEPFKGVHEELIAGLIPIIKDMGLPIIVTSHSAFETNKWGGTIVRLG